MLTPPPETVELPSMLSAEQLKTNEALAIDAVKTLCELYPDPTNEPDAHSVIDEE